MWWENAKYLEAVYGVYVDWDERFYECPKCGELVYECDWTDEDMRNFFCPICEFREEDEEED